MQAVVTMDSENGHQTPAGELHPHVRGAATAIALGIALGATSVLVAGLLLRVSDDVIYAPLFVAVVTAVWAAGGAGGITAVVCGWGLTAWALLPPRWSFAVSSRDDFVRWAVSLAAGLIVVGVGFGMRRGHERAALVAEREERSRQRVERLQALAASLSAALTPEEVARAMVEGVPAAIGARGGALGLVEGDELVIVDPAGATGQTLVPGSRMALTTRAPITVAAREGKPAWAQRRREFVSRFPDGAALASYASGALAVPVFMGERLAGAMGFPFAEPDSVTAEVRTVARIAADLGGQALERAELYAQERSSREALDRILAVAPRFQQGATPETVAASVCAEARRAFGCDVVQVWTPVDGDQLEVTWRAPPSDVIPPGTRIDFADFPGLIDEMRAFRSMFVPNAQLHTRGEALAHAKRLGLFSSLRIPIVIGAQFDRILALQWERVIPEPAPSVIAVARRFADQAGLAIEQAARRRAQDETRGLQAVTEALSAAATPAEVGAAIVRQGVAALGARAATVYALSEDGEGLELVASEGYSTGVTSAWQRIPLDAETPVTDAIRRREVVSCLGFEEIATLYPWFDRTDESFVAAPLIAAGRAIGSVFIGSLDGTPSRRVSRRRREPCAPGGPGARPRSAVRARAGIGQQAAEAASGDRLAVESRHDRGREPHVPRARAGGRRRYGRADRASASRREARHEHEHGDGGERARAAPTTRSRRQRRRRSRPACKAASRPDPTWVGPHFHSRTAPSPSSHRRRSGHSQGPTGNGCKRWRARARRRSVAPAGTRPNGRPRRRCSAASCRNDCRRSPGITLAARYLPGSVGVDVGGDWYDAIQLEDGRVGLVVGDVVGKGVQAAAMMGQLRNALRAFAFEHTDPGEVVSRLGRLVDGMLEAPFATLAYLVVDPRTCRLRYAVAGHPPPLVVSPDGSAGFLEGGRTLPIGVDGSATFETGDAELAEGATIVLYTDGLVERRGRSLDEGLGLLAGFASQSDGDPEELVETLIAELLGDGRETGRRGDSGHPLLHDPGRGPQARRAHDPGRARRDALEPPIVAFGRTGRGRCGRRGRPRHLGGGRQRDRACPTSVAGDIPSRREVGRRGLAAGRGAGQRPVETG